MFEEKALQLRGIDQAFANVDEKGFEGDADGMGRTTTSGARGLPLLDDAPLVAKRKGHGSLSRRDHDRAWR